MKRRPVIGITCKLISDGGDSYLKLDRNYVRSVERAGAEPLIVPFLRSPREAKALLDRADGMLFTGGPDIDPRRWGERKHPKADLMHPDRERSDFLLMREALRRDLPVLCICCGHQELNVAMGGTLDQHLYDRKGVRRHSGGATHPVEMVDPSKTREILGMSRAVVNSWHHQAIRKVAPGLRVTATCPDGVIEGVESEKHRWVVSVQWHPERMQADRRQQALFRALVAEAMR